MRYQRDYNANSNFLPQLLLELDERRRVFEVDVLDGALLDLLIDDEAVCQMRLFFQAVERTEADLHAARRVRHDVVRLLQRHLGDLRVEQASVRRSLPSTLEIQIVERRPVATVDCDFGYVDLDREGTVIDAYKTLKKMAIPMVTGIKLKDIYIGDKTTDENLKAALVYLNALKPETNAQISEVSLKKPDDVMAYTTGGVQIRLGALDRLEEKAHLTDSFIVDQEVKQRPVEYVDFKYTAPFIKLKQ